MSMFETSPLGQIATLLSGGTPSKARPDLWAGDVPWLTPKDMGRWIGRTEQSVSPSALGNGTRLAPPRSSFVAVRGMSLHNEIRILHSDTPLTFNQDIKAVVAKGGIDPYFLYYALFAQKPQLLEWVSAAGHGTGVLSTDRLASLPIPDVPIAKQRELANIFKALDDKLELNRRTNETLEAMAQAIFRDWFVDFGPVRRKMEGASDPVTIMGGVTTDPTRAAKLAALFPSKFELEGQPIGWARSTADDLIEFNPSVPLRKGTLAPYLEMAALPTAGSTTDAPVERQFGSGMRFVNGDALLARITPCLENGKACFVDTLPEGAVGWGSTEFFVLRARPPCPPPMGYLLCRDPEFRTLAVQSMTGTSGRQRAQLDMLKAWPLAIPPEAVLRAFGTFVEPLFAKITAAAAENRTLAETRDYLLPRLMSGEVRIQEAEEAASTMVAA
jgi:type I restriction enzyme S subunit